MTKTTTKPKADRFDPPPPPAKAEKPKPPTKRVLQAENTALLGKLADAEADVRSATARMIRAQDGAFRLSLLSLLVGLLLGGACVWALLSGQG